MFNDVMFWILAIDLIELVKSISFLLFSFNGVFFWAVQLQLSILSSSKSKQSHL